MQIKKNIDHYFFENEHGSYHLSIPKYNELGKEKAIEFVTEEIRKKGRKFTGKTIDFVVARSLGFCEYGIEDFCNQLDLDINGVYEIEFLKSILTKEVVSDYFDECFKLFGLNVFDKWGGVISYLEETKEINIVLRVEIIPEYNLHLLSVKFAYSVLDNFEKEFPDDDRPRKVIEYKEAYVRGDITLEQLLAAKSAARSATESATKSAAWSAAWSARSAESAAWSARSAESARSATESAAKSATWSAWSATKSAAWSAAKSAEIDKQIKEVVKVLKGLGY